MEFNTGMYRFTMVKSTSNGSTEQTNLYRLLVTVRSGFRMQKVTNNLHIVCKCWIYASCWWLRSASVTYKKSPTTVYIEFVHVEMSLELLVTTFHGIGYMDSFKEFNWANVEFFCASKSSRDGSCKIWSFGSSDNVPQPNHRGAVGCG